MKNTTLGYIEYDNQYLMLYRNIDKKDGSLGKWLGVGGKFEENETSDECFLREVMEETGISLSSDDITLRGIVDFESNNYESERMYLYTVKVNSNYFDKECNEGNLKWIKKDEILSLNMWEGDHVFLEKLLNNEPYFTLTLIYGGESGDTLISIK